MKKVLLASTAIAGLLAGTSPAMAEGPLGLPSLSGFYVSVFAGGSISDDVDLTTVVGVPYTLSIDSDTGYVLGVAVGVKIMPNLRGEIEYSYSKANIDNITLSQGAASISSAGTGELETKFILANLWYDFDIGGPVTPYVGGGIGWGDVVDLSTIAKNNLDGFAWQLGAGAKYDLTDHLSLDVSYRFKQIVGVNFAAFTADEDVNSHNIQAAITYTFGN